MKPGANLRIDLDRLMGRIEALGAAGALPGGGVCRLALGDADRDGRDLVVSWMKELGLAVAVDRIGNVVGVRAGQEACAPVMTGSHIDTVATGGLYDGSLGVLAGLEVIACLNDAGIVTRRPLAVGFFTNEEGARFAPDMMGSAVHQGSLSLDEALETKDREGESVGEALARIGYLGDVAVPGPPPHCFIELHVEQGPILEEAGITIGAVTGVQGISWTELVVTGVSNHAGTTPLRLRHDAGYVAAALAVEARRLAEEMGANQVATVGVTRLSPNLINVIAGTAVVTLDLRNTNDELLTSAEVRMAELLTALADREGVAIESRVLARFAPVAFDTQMVNLVESTATDLGFSVMRLPSGAGHDAQMFAPNCPTAMVFVPSEGGISHNVEEFTGRSDIAAGANVLLQAMLAKAS